MRVMSGVCLGYSKWAYLFIQKKKLNKWVLSTMLSLIFRRLKITRHIKKKVNQKLLFDQILH